MGVLSLPLQVLSSCALLWRPVNGGLFLARLPEPELRQVLLGEIEAALGSNLHDVTKQRLGEIEAALKPTYDVLPKNQAGRLDHDGVRYLLNRVFSQHHGWFVNGLQRGAEAWNSSAASSSSSGEASSSGASMRDHLPEVLQELFEARVGANGVQLREVVAFAAMIEHLIRDELRGKLETIYQAKAFQLEAGADAEQAINFMELYMICFLRGEDASAWDEVKIERLEQRFQRQYPEWDGVKELIRSIFDSSLGAEQSVFSFDDIASMLEIVADRFAAFYELQCEDLKGALLEREDRRSGRVKLGDFYRAALEDGMYQFTETVEVLRHIGTLDEADPSNPRLIIPNYVAGISNCIARTSFYSTCCPNSCETLLNRVEQSLGKAEASAAEIAAAVEAPDAALESGFHGLTPWLRKRLEDLAKHHGGQIPLHGRLFAQWMHYVHPRDCVYPHVSGTTYRKSLDDWERELGQSSGLSMQQLKNMTEHLHDLAAAAPKDVESIGEVEESCSMWTMEEELFVKRMEAPFDAEGESFGGLTRFALLAVAAGSLFAGVSAVVQSPEKSKAYRKVDPSLLARNV
eukprot:TRINITY_DN18972_c0_g1_i1.p1 TRINITY_DN18972_c0_g1~~TRINITY_DN18972_c0_g1_i1.p1  ORF type:complete len:598 (+),score=151.85 TRINITY_DN18972_c0_g1_i1:70-1794(+)